MKNILRCILITFSLILIWQATIRYFALPNYLLPTPLEVAHIFYTQYPLLLQQTLPTLVEILLGFILGILLGSIIGFITAFSRLFRYGFLPILLLSQAIPTFAIAPLLVVWLGYGLASKIATTILMIFFPIASSFYDGLCQTPHAWLDLAKTMNATKWRTFFTIRIPAALPHLASGMRIAAVFAPMGAVVGEWVGSSQGLGYLMLNANARLQIDLMFAALIIIILLTLFLYFSVDRLLRIIIWW